MKISLTAKARKALALVLVGATLTLPSFAATGTAAKATNDTYNSYFNDVYPKLTDKSPVFETVTYSRLNYLLNQSGNYVILWGGKTSAALQNDIQAIDEVAKQYGVTKIYNFDPQLDGGVNGDIANIASDSAINYAKQIYAKVYAKLYPGTAPADLTGTISYTDPSGSYTVAQIPSPSLIVYNKDNKVSGTPTPVIGRYTDTTATGAATADLKTAVSALFDKITVSGSKVASVATYDNEKFFTDAFNFEATINNGNTTTNIFDNTDHPVTYKSVTYDELIQLLKSKGNYVILFGGSWCPNTRAAIKWINQEAKAYNIDTVYNFDTHLDDRTHSDADPLNIRANKVAPVVTITDNADNAPSGANADSPIRNLYADLVNNYLPNIQTQYGPRSNITYTDANGTHSALKLQVPFVFTYNKDAKDANGNAAPILRENVIKNPDTGAIKELMYSWSNTQPGSANYNTEVATLDALFQAFNVQVTAASYSSIVANQSKYTADSYAAFSSALTNAQTVAADLLKTKDDIKAAADQLDQAKQALVTVTGTNSGTNGGTTPGTTTNPKTGDNSRLIVILPLAALAGAVALTVNTRRKKAAK